MTEGGISKKVFFGVLALEAITDIAVADTDGKRTLYYVCILAALVVCYWAKQTFLDYTSRKKTT